MSRLRPKMSITLPRNFTYHSPDDVEPKTPDNQHTELKLPPPPRHATCRPNRSRPRLDVFMQLDHQFGAISAEDVPIPSIELPQQPFETSRPQLRQSITEPSSDASEGLLPTLPNPMLSSPRTPPAQIHASPFGPEPSSQWALRASSMNFSTERPSSSCSGISDSSISSEGSFVSHPSFGGSCTSPESDVQDPFIPSIRIKRFSQDSPTKGKSTLHLVPVARAKVEWTAEMDNHIWNTYQIYLQDPTVTPFKMVPGSIPPLGVSHRVAREAKRTWSKFRKASHPPCKISQPLRDVLDNSQAVMNEAPDTATPVRSGSTTPTAIHEAFKSAWPRSESATRRRLKELCKKKSSIPIHYQRLLASRSPSPFVDPLVPRRNPRPSRLGSSSSISSFSGATRDLEVALVSSSATGPLTQLTNGDSPPVSDDWFNHPVEVSQPTQTASEIGLGIETEDTKHLPTLGSPFAPKNWGHKTWGPSHSRQKTRPKTPVNHETIHVTGPRLMSPARFDPFSNANKRRAQHQLEDELSPGGTDLQVQSNLQDVFTTGSKADISQRRVRLRNRGVTMGAVGGTDKLNRLFSPPTPTQPDRSPLTQPSSGFLDAPAEGPKRLGSPFEADGNKSGKRPISRHAPSLSDPFVGESFDSMNLPSINQALDGVGGRGAENDYPFNDLEPGLTDAERINRQIKNFFASRS
jgi:hypothetical protein